MHPNNMKIILFLLRWTPSLKFFLTPFSKAWNLHSKAWTPTPKTHELTSTMKIIVFSYYHENNIIIFILWEVHAFGKEGVYTFLKGGLIFFWKGGSQKGGLMWTPWALSLATGLLNYTSAHLAKISRTGPASNHRTMCCPTLMFWGAPASGFITPPCWTCDANKRRMRGQRYRCLDRE